MSVVKCTKVEFGSSADQMYWVTIIGIVRVAIGAGVDVFNHHRARSRTIALPQFFSVDSIVTWEIKHIAENTCLVDVRISGSIGVYVLDHNCASGGTVTLPQSVTVSVVFRFEYDAIPKWLKKTAETSVGATDSCDHNRARFRSIALP